MSNLWGMCEYVWEAHASLFMMGSKCSKSINFTEDYAKDRKSE